MNTATTKVCYCNRKLIADIAISTEGPITGNCYKLLSCHLRPDIMGKYLAENSQ